MNSGFLVFCDSSSDIPEELQNKYNLNTIPFYVSFDEKEYLRENIDIYSKEFYKKLSTVKTLPKTSLPSIEDYINYFTPALKKGLDVLCICISSKLSGSYQSACNARNILKEEFPKRNIYIIDSEQATASQGLLVIQALEMQKKNFDIEKVYNIIESLKTTGTIYFSPNTLEYLKKGGRIGKANSIAGALLNIKPILYLKEGEVYISSKEKGRKKVISKLIELTKNIIKEDELGYEIAIAHSDCKDEAMEFLETLENELDIKINYPLFNVGISIGTHVGEGAIGVAIIKNHYSI